MQLLGNATAMSRASFGFLLRHPLQLGLALLGIAAGVSVMVAVDLANVSAKRAFLLSIDTLNGRATHQIVGGPTGIDEALYVDLRIEHGVRSVAPVVEGSVAAGGLSLTLLGVDPFAEAGIRDFAAIGTGQADTDAEGAGGLTAIRALLTEPGTVLMTAQTASRLGVSAGEPFEIDVAGQSFTAQLIASLGENADGLQNVLVSDVSTAQEWLDMVGKLTRIDVRIDSEAVTKDSLTALLPADVELVAAEQRQTDMADMTQAFMTNLTAMSLLAMLVGLFLIYNCVSFAVLQRRTLLGTLRALGVTREETLELILVEAVLLGVVGALVGLLAGIWLAELLLELVSRSINDLYFRVSVTEVSISAWSIAKGFVAGVGATVLASAVPAIEAARVPPSLALRRSLLESRSRRMVAWLAVGGVCLSAVAMLLVAASGANLIAGLVALFALIIGIALLIPLLVVLLVPGLAAVAAALAGASARLSVLGVQSALSRTGVAIVALAVAVSATIGVTVMVSSFRLAVIDWLTDTLQADVYVTVRRGELDPELTDSIRRVSGIAEVSSSRSTTLYSAQGQTIVIALDRATGRNGGTRLLGADPANVWPRFDNENVVLVSETYAYRNGVGAGDTISLRTDAGVVNFRVLARYRSYDANQGAVVMHRNTYLRHWSDTGIDALGLFLDEGAERESVVADILALSRGRQDIRLTTNSDIRDASLAVFDQTFVITNVLYWLATGVAVVGIFGAMLAFQLERARELGLLRALGLTPAQLAALITLQAAVMGLLAGLAAIPLGIVMANVLIEVINRRSFGWQMDMVVGTGDLFAALGLAIVAAVAAGLYPAWRSGRIAPALAMREE